MTWTYAGTPGTATAAERRDFVRFNIGDTVSGADPTLSDEEIGAMLSMASNSVPLATLSSAQGLLARFAQQADFTRGKVSVSASQRYKNLVSLITKLESDSFATSTAGPYAGGTSKADKSTLRENTGAVQPIIAVGDYVYPGLSDAPLPTLAP